MKPLRRNLFLQAALAAGVVALLLGGLAVLLLSSGALGTSTKRLSPAQVQQLGDFRLPASATGLQAHYEGWQDHILWARFQMIAADEAAFWSGTRCTTATQSLTGIPSLIRGQRPWQLSGQPSPFEAREVQLPGNDGQQVLIDKSNRSGYTVYLVRYDF